MHPGADPSGGGDIPGLRVGDWVEVRSPEEILGTLDEQGCLDALPLMPEMLQYCGKRFRVYKSAHKACDTLKSWKTLRRMRDAVHLEGLRCDGGAHGGCQAGCLLYWKEAWLKRAAGPRPKEDLARTPPVPHRPLEVVPRCDMEALHRATRVAAAVGADSEERYRCQATEMLRATTPVRWDPRPYVRDIVSGNVRPRDFVRFVLIAAFNRLRPFPHIRGRSRSKTPAGEALNLQPGEWVQVRSKDEILRTLNRKLRHRGLSFDVEMLPFCGKTFRVLRRVARLIDERSGEMRFPRGPCLILEGVVCGGCLSRNRMFCPRSIYPYWHEIWLKRVDRLESGPGVPPSSPG